MKLKLILTMAIVGVALALPSVVEAARLPASAAQPTLSIERNCEAIPGANTVNVIAQRVPGLYAFRRPHWSSMEAGSVRFSSRPMRMGASIRPASGSLETSSPSRSRRPSFGQEAR